MRPAVLPLTVLLVLAGCAGSDPERVAGPESTARPTFTIPEPGVTEPPVTTEAGLTPEDEAAILETVDGYWRTIVEANDPPDPDHPGFDRYFTGAAKERSVARTHEHLSQGTLVLDPGGVDRFSTRIEVADSIQVRECFIDDAVVVRADDRSVVNDAVSSVLVRFTLERSEVGQWQVSLAESEASVGGSFACRSQSP